jgi:hypothetical protein
MCVCLFILTNSTYSQIIRKEYQYKNFEGAKITIELELTSTYVQNSNQNWYDLIKTGFNANKNYFAMIESLFNNNRDSLKFIYDMFQRTLPNVSDNYFINTVIRFIQNIPYKIPPMLYKGKSTSGIFAPAICLAEGYGDCDTKSLLLCCILAHKYELIFLAGAHHAFIGIKCSPGKKQEYVEIDGNKYVLCEMTSQWELGNLPVSSKFDINKGKYKYIILKY